MIKSLVIKTLFTFILPLALSITLFANLYTSLKKKREAYKEHQRQCAQEYLEHWKKKLDL